MLVEDPVEVPVELTIVLLKLLPSMNKAVEVLEMAVELVNVLLLDRLKM